MGKKIRRTYIGSSLFLLLLTTSMGAKAQDRIVTKDGEEVEGWQVEVSGSDVLYKEWNTEDAPIRRMDKGLVQMIRRSDGRKEMLTEGQQPTDQLHGNLGEANSETNEIVKRNYCGEVRYVGESIDMKAEEVLAVSRPMAGSTFANKDIEVKFSKIYNYKYKRTQPEKKITLTNHTDKVIYLDMANSYFRMGTKIKPFYVQGATTNTTHRVESIPPRSSDKECGLVNPFYIDYLSLYPSIFVQQETLNLFKVASRGTAVTLKRLSPPLLIGQSVKYEEKNSPALWGMTLTYSFDENLTNPQTIQSDFYISEYIGTKKKQAETSCIIDNGVIFHVFMME